MKPSHFCEVPACLESIGELPEPCIPLQSCYTSTVHVTNATTVKLRASRFVSTYFSCSVPDETHIDVIEGNMSRLLVPRTLITIQEWRASIWVVNTDLKPQKVSPGKIVGYAEVVEPGEVKEVRGSDFQPTSQFLQAPSEGAVKGTTDGQAPKFLHSPRECVWWKS